jgi:hypothetical protein
MNDMNTQRILLAALAALVAGIGIGLLLAPNRGSDSEMEMDARSGNSFSN